MKKFPQNSLVQDVLLKVSVINSLYSTNIYAVHEISYHIQKLNIDCRLISGDLSLVEDIATGHGKGRRFFSFATKYCNWHRPDIYPIYDSFVEKTLIAVRDNFKFS